MGEQKPEKTKKHICAGLLAHVIAEKTIEKSMVFFYAGRIRHTFNGCLK